MSLIDKTKVLDITKPAHRQSVWEDITTRYNAANQSEEKMTKKQIIDKHQNYKGQLRTEKSKMIRSSKKTGMLLYYTGY